MSDIKPNINVKLPSVQNSPVNVEPVAADVVLTQADIDLETSKVRLEAEKLKLKRELLELEKLTADVERLRSERAKSAISHETVEDALSFQRQTDERNQNLCTHMKGGESTQLLHGAPSMGNDSGNYAMIDHTFTHGVRFRMCQRCGKTWFPNDPDYRWAMSRPTRNSASSGCPSPGLVPEANRRKPVEKGGPRLTSEIPHKVQPQPDSPFGPIPGTAGPAGY